MTQQPAGYLCRGGVPDMEVAAYTTVVCLRLVVSQLEHLHRVVTGDVTHPPRRVRVGVVWCKRQTGGQRIPSAA